MGSKVQVCVDHMDDLLIDMVLTRDDNRLAVKPYHGMNRREITSDPRSMKLINDQIHTYIIVTT